MKRFDPHVGGAGQGLSAGKSHRSLKTLLRNAAVLSLFATGIVHQVQTANAAAVSLTTTTYTQNFDSATTSSLPAGWAMNTTKDNYNGTAFASGTAGATNLALATATATTGSAYIFKDTSNDQTLGFLGSGTLNGTPAVYFAFTNNTGSAINKLDLSWNYEKFRSGTSGTAGAYTFFTGTSATTYTAQVSGNNTITSDANNTVYSFANNELQVAKSVSITGLSIASGSTYYMEWVYQGGSSAQAWGVDDFSLTATLVSVGGNYWVGGSGSWTSSSPNFSTTSGGSTGLTQATFGALVFDTPNAAPTVSGSVAAPAGLTFSANGINISQGTINLSGASAATNVIIVTNAGDTATIGSVISGTNGLTMSGPGKLILTGTNTLTGAVTLTGGTLRATAAGALGAGTLSIGGGTLELESNNGVSFNRNTTVSADATIKSDRAAQDAGAGATQTLGTLSIGGQTLTIDKGSNATGTTAGIAFGTVSLTGSPTFTVNNGTQLSFGATSLAGNTTISVTSGLLTLASISGNTFNTTFAGSGNTTVSGAITTTTGSITKSGNGILTLSGNNTNTGGLFIDAGAVILNNVGSLNSTTGSENAVAFGSGSTGTLSLNSNNITLKSLNTHATPGTTYVQNDGSSNAILTIGNSVTADSTFAGVIRNNSASAVGTLGVIKAGTGTLTLTNANTYTGGTTLNNGTLKLSGAGALASGTVAISGGTLSVVNAAGVDSLGGALTGTSNSIAGNVNLNSGIIDLTAGSLSVGGALTLSGGTIKYTLGKTLAVTGQLSLSAPVNVTLDGSYTVGAIYTLLSYSNTSSSPDFVNKFKISLLNNSLGKWTYDTNESSAGVYKITILSLASNLKWYLSGDGDWDKSTVDNWYNNKTSATQAFTDGDNVTFDNSTGGIINIISTVTPGSVTVNTAVGGDYTFKTGSIAGDGGITKSGVGKLTLSHANTFTGEVVVNAGTLVVGDANALGTITTGTRILSGATLELSNDITTLAAEPLTLVGTGVAGVGALTSQPGVHTVSGSITLGGDTLITSQGSPGADTFTIEGPITGSNSTLTLGGSASTVISGNISGIGLALNKTGNGILTLSGSSNSYTGLTSVNAGTLVAQTATSIPSAVAVSSGATLSLQDNQTLTSLTGSGQVSVADGKTFTLDTGTSAQSFGGTFTGTRGTSFTKSGSGTLNLSGASTSLARDFTLSAGTVKASNNNALGAGTVLIGTGGSGTTGTLYVAKDKTISNNITVGSSVRGTNALLAGWDFQTTTSGGTAVVAATNTPTSYVANLGRGTLYLNGTNGSSSWSQATELSGFGGSSKASGAVSGNAYFGFSAVSTSPSSLALLGGTSNAANNKSLVFAIDMSNKVGLTITYDAQKTSTGFSSHLWEFSTDGSTWTSPQTISNLTTPFATQTLTSVTALNGDSAAFVRLTVSGSSGTSQNNRLDNISFMALGADSTTGSGILGIDEAGTATFTGNVVVNNTAELTAATGGTAIFKDGVISGLGSLTKTGNGTVELKGLNTFTGSLTLSAGNLKVSTLGAGGAASPLGAGADVPGSIIFKGGKLEYAGSGETLTRDFTVGNEGAGFIASGAGALVIGQDAQMDFDNAAASNRTLSLGGATEIAIENIFNPSKVASADVTKLFTKLVKQDVNKWVVLGAGAGFVDEASTEVNINGGELDFEMGALGSKSTINVGTATLGWYNSSNTEDLSGRINLTNGASAAFNTPPNNTLLFTKSFNGGAATTASLIKLGTGTLELGAANNFSGGLTVSAGTVKANYAGAVGSGTVTISSKATLVVNAILANKINVTSGGTLAGNAGEDTDETTIDDGGLLSPNEDNVGKLSFNKLTLNGGAKVKWQIKDAKGNAGTGYDTLVITLLQFNNITSNNKVKITVANSGTLTNFDKTKVNKFEFAKLKTALSDGLNVTDLFEIDKTQFEIDNLNNDHLVWSMQLSADRDMLYVTTMIPEPSTYGLGLSALALAAVAVRRRKKKKV
jgi:fibronectin-binding autotransporter adhesin